MPTIEIGKELDRYLSRNKKNSSDLSNAVIFLNQCDPNNKYSLAKSSFASKLLISAIIQKNKTLVRLLLNYGLDPNTEYSNKKTALHFACTQPDCKDIVELLLKHQAKQRKDSRDQYPLDYAIEFGYSELVKPLLINNLSYINEKDRFAKLIALTLNSQQLKNGLFLACVACGEKNKAMQCLDNGAELSSTDDKGDNAVLLAAQHGKRDILDYLVKPKEDGGAGLSINRTEQNRSLFFQANISPSLSENIFSSKT
jgi:ankyrin repeat protein